MKDGKYIIGMIKPSTEGRGQSAGSQKKMLPENVSLTSVALGIKDLVPSQLTAALSGIEQAAGELLPFEEVVHFALGDSAAVPAA